MVKTQIYERGSQKVMGEDGDDEETLGEMPKWGSEGVITSKVTCCHMGEVKH